MCSMGILDCICFLKINLLVVTFFRSIILNDKRGNTSNITKPRVNLRRHGYIDFIEACDCRILILPTYQIHGLYIGLLTGRLIDDDFDSIQFMEIFEHHSHLGFVVPYNYFYKLPIKPNYGVIMHHIYLCLFLIASFLVFLDKLFRIYYFRCGLWEDRDDIDLSN